MIKDVTILTFDEVERIKCDIDNMIDKAKAGAWGKFDAKSACDWLITDLTAFRMQFE